MYGVIDYDISKSCTFKLRNASFYVNKENKRDIEGKKVCFELKSFQDKYIAVNVDLEDE